MAEKSSKEHILFIFYFFKGIFSIYYYFFMIVIQREREGQSRDTGRGRSRLHAPGARCGIRSRVSRITPWAKGRRQTTAPPRDPACTLLTCPSELCWAVCLSVSLVNCMEDRTATGQFTSYLGLPVVTALQGAWDSGQAGRAVQGTLHPSLFR